MLTEGADGLGDAVATDGEVAEPGVGAGPFAAAEDAPGAAVDPLTASATAQLGVGAGSLSERVDVAACDEALVGALAVTSAEAIEIGESEANAAAPSAIAETLRTLLVMETSISTAAQRATQSPLRPVGLIGAPGSPGCASP